LWAAKQEVAVIMDEYNATYILESVFPSVFTILTLTPQPTGGAGRRPVFTRREFDREVVVEIGAGDLRASIRAAAERDARVVAVDPEPPTAAAIAELETAGGTYLQGTAENVPAASADLVFQFFPTEVGAPEGRGTAAHGA
jgi:hypothetical protein